MNCQRGQTYLMQHFDRNLHGRKQEELEQHLLTCPSCQTLLKDLAAVLGDLEAISAVEPPPELERHLLEQISQLTITDHGLSKWFKVAAWSLVVTISLFLSMFITINVMNISFFDLLAQGTQYLNNFSGIIINIQILYPIITNLCSEALVPLLQEIQYYYLTAAFLVVLIGIKMALQNSRVENVNSV